MSSVSDLLAHLTPLPVQVTVQGREFTVPALDALGWLAVLTDKHAALYDVFPGMAGHEAIEFVEDLLWDGVLTTKQVDDLAYDVIAAAGDRPWWEILRIIGAATGAWHLVHVNAVVGKSLAG